MTRPYYCWQVRLTFRCGCVEHAPTTHSCGPGGAGCNTWLTLKYIGKDCEAHRVGGLHGARADDSAAGVVVDDEEEGDGGTAGSEKKSKGIGIGSPRASESVWQWQKQQQQQQQQTWEGQYTRRRRAGA